MGERQPAQPSAPRARVAAGSLVTHNGRNYLIKEVVDLSTAIATDYETRETKLLPMADVEHDVHVLAEAHRLPIDELSQEEEEIARKRLEAIRPLLKMQRRSKTDVEARSREVGHHYTTLYRWIKLYEAFEDYTSLVPRRRGPAKGTTRLSPVVEGIIADVIEEYYLTPLRPGPEKAIREVHRRCQEHTMEAPSPTTVRKRIKQIDEWQHLERRGEPERARRNFRPATGHFPNADFPLSVVQIDHTLADIILVDDVDRQPIGRPWITLAVDVYSRVITGYYLSLDAPSITSVGMCITHSMLSKEEWLLRHNIDAQWPIWGVPDVFYVDNGPDFRSEDIQSACLKHGVEIEYRPVKEPKFGGHIERLIGNLMRSLQGVPGGTFSSIAKRGEHDPEKFAALTKGEFEKWFLIWVNKDYHHRPHSAINCTPLDRWQRGILGDRSTLGRGVPAKPRKPEDLVRDFLPSFQRTVQHDGVAVDGLKYFGQPLRRWIRRSDPLDPKKTCKFTFRRDPRDISRLWFYDPDMKEYFKIPLADQSIPPMSLWEYKRVRRYLSQQSISSPQSSQLIRAFDEMRQIEDYARTETKSMESKRLRLDRQRRRDHANAVTPASPLGFEQPTEDPTEESEFSYEPVEAFDIIC